MEKKYQSGSKIGSSLSQGFFPNPLASAKEMQDKRYGLQYSQAIEQQWELTKTSNTIYQRRILEFETNRDYAAGRQDTSIYKQILTALDNNDNDSTLLNLDWTPVPIIPKFVDIVIDKTLDRKPRPNLKAIDPISLTEKDNQKAKILAAMAEKDLIRMAQEAGLQTDIDVSKLPDSTDELEIFKNSTIKTDGEVAAQIGAAITLQWNDFDETVLRQLVRDLVECGMAVPMRYNDPLYGIIEKRVKPERFIHSYTEDSMFGDIHYGGHIEQVTLGELKRLAGDEFTDEEYHKIAKLYANTTNSYENRGFNRFSATDLTDINRNDEYIVDILHFQFKATERQYFEEKETKHGTKGFYNKGTDYKQPKNSIYERKPHFLDIEVTYSGVKVIGLPMIFGYQKDSNMPRNMYDVTRTNLRYFPVAVNIRDMMPTSMVKKIRSYADIIQITHLKWQQALAKVKNDGLMIDIEGLENVDLGRGGSMSPLDLHDVYEKTSIYYYRSKTIDGKQTGAPLAPIPQRFDVFNALALSHNQALNAIRDITGINEPMDGTSPKGEQLVGVREQAIQAGNNAIYHITICMKVMYKRIVEDIVKCLQVLPKEAVIYKMYENAIGKTNMKILEGFKKLPMVNFGVDVVLEMDENERTYLENNIQVSIAQKELDVEDAIAIRNIQDIDQAEQLLIIRRKKRMKAQQDMQIQNINAQAQANAQSAQAAIEGEMQKEQALHQLKMAEKELEHKLEMERIALEYEMKKEIAMIEANQKFNEKQSQEENLKQREDKREKAKDERIEKQAALQSQMIDQRKGTAPRIEKPMDGTNSLIDQLINTQ